MNLFKRYNLSSVIGTQTALSNTMLEYLELWNNILQGKAPWNEDAHPCGVVDCTIGQLAKPVGEEMEVESKNEKLQIVMKRLNELSHEHVQNIVAVGGEVVRPVYVNGKVQFEIIKLGNYIPTSYDLDGTLTGCIITKKIQDGKKEFLLLETHDYHPWTNPETKLESHQHTIELTLYLITGGNQLRKAMLSDCIQTKDMTESYSYDDVEFPMIVEIRNRMPNKIDGSEVPCALWQGTENLIEESDKQFERICWEQEGGELKVFADEDLFKRKQGDKEGKLYPELNRLMVKLNGNGIDSEKVHDYAPALRTQQQVEAFNQILRRCELAWNIGKGTLSDLEQVVQTATQYTGGKKVLYSMVDSIESELEDKYKKLASVFAYIISAYEPSIAYDDEITITYNDSGRKDPIQMKQIALQELAQGIISPAEYRMMFFGETEEVANAKVPEPTTSNNFGGFNLE